MALAHDERGEGPAVVLLHAGIADRSMWAEHLEPLAAAGHRAIAFDLPGFGDSPLPAGELAEWVEVVRAMDELGVERAALVGNSFGGEVALRVALIAPERVSGLVLVSASPPEFEPSPELDAAWEAEEAAMRRGDTEAAVAAVVEAWTLPGAPADVREHLAAMQRRTYANRPAAEPDRAPDPLEEDPGLLGSIDVRTLVAVGALDKRDFLDGGRAMAAALPRATFAPIEDAGHLAPLEQPAAFRELVLGFLG